MSAAADDDASPGGDAGDAVDAAASPRPWTMAAAMEPVAPLAPPPARPGHGTALTPQPRDGLASHSQPSGSRIGLWLLLLGAAVVVGLLLLFAR